MRRAQPGIVGRRRPRGRLDPARPRCAPARRSACRFIAFAVLSACTFSNAVIRDLNVDVVDQDRSPTSDDLRPGGQRGARRHRRAAARTISPRRHACRPLRARRSPPSTFRAASSATSPPGARPQIVIFYNKQFFTPGNVASERAAARGLGGGWPSCRACRRSVGLHARSAGRRIICADQSRPELCPVPAAGHPADRAAHRDRHLRRAMPSARSSAARDVGDWLRDGRRQSARPPWSASSLPYVRHLPPHHGRRPRSIIHGAVRGAVPRQLRA